MDKNNTNDNQNYDLTSGYTADDEEAPTPSRTTIIWNRILKITLLVDLVLILIVGSYCLYKYIGGDEIVPPAADLEYTPQPFNKELAREVLDYQDPNPLMSAIATDQPLAAIQKILDSGIDVNAQDATGNTALHYAIFRENRKLIKLLLNHGADVDIKNNKDIYPVRLSFDYSLDQTSSILVFPEDYDDNGIITRAGILRHTLNHNFIDKFLLHIFTFLILGIVIASRNNQPDYRPFRKIITYIIRFSVIFISLLFISYIIYLFTLEYPYQHIIHYSIIESKIILANLLLLLIIYIGYLLSRRLFNLYRRLFN